MIKNSTCIYMYIKNKNKIKITKEIHIIIVNKIKNYQKKSINISNKKNISKNMMIFIRYNNNKKKIRLNNKKNQKKLNKSKNSQKIINLNSLSLLIIIIIINHNNCKKKINKLKMIVQLIVKIKKIIKKQIMNKVKEVVIKNILEREI